MALTPAQFLPASYPPSSVKHVRRDVFAFPTIQAPIRAAGTFYVNLCGFLKPGLMNVGIGAQCSAAASIAFTMESAEDVTRSDGDAMWMTPIVLVPNEFTALVDVDGHPIFGSCARIIAPGPCKLFIGAL